MDQKIFKKFIYDTLIGDATLVSLVGGTDHIFQQYPKNKKPELPILYYFLIPGGELTFPQNEDQRESKMTEIVFGINFETNSDTSVSSDDVANRLYELFNGKIFNTTELIVYASSRTYNSQDKIPDTEIWQTVNRFTMLINFK
jgi:hypothetical protein